MPTPDRAARLSGEEIAEIKKALSKARPNNSLSHDLLIDAERLLAHAASLAAEVERLADAERVAWALVRAQELDHPCIGLAQNMSDPQDYRRRLVLCTSTIAFPGDCPTLKQIPLLTSEGTLTVHARAAIDAQMKGTPDAR